MDITPDLQPVDQSRTRREWSEGLQRLVLALAMRGDLLSRVTLDPDLFGSPSSGAPRRRIAACMAEYWEQYKSRPVPEIVDDLVKKEGERLSAPERAALQQEWSWVIETEMPDDSTYVYQEVSKGIEYQRLKNTLGEALQILRDGGPDAVEAAREKLTAPPLGGTEPPVQASHHEGTGTCQQE